MSWFFELGGQSIGASVSASVFPMNIQGWFPLGLTDFNLLSVQYALKSFLQHCSKASTLWRLAFFIEVKWKWKLPSRVQPFATPWLYSPRNSPGQNTGVWSLSLLQEIIPTQGSNPARSAGGFFTCGATGVLKTWKSLVNKWLHRPRYRCLLKAPCYGILMLWEHQRPQKTWILPWPP